MIGYKLEFNITYSIVFILKKIGMLDVDTTIKLVYLNI